MSIVISFLIVVVVVLASGSWLVQAGLSAASDLIESWDGMMVRQEDIQRTGIQVLAVANSGSTVDITLKNNGQQQLSAFADWDVTVEYYETDGTYHQKWLAYTATDPPAANKWTVEGIYADASGAVAESFHPGILDPTEEMIVRVALSPSARTTADNYGAIVTPNGVSASSSF